METIVVLLIIAGTIALAILLAAGHLAYQAANHLAYHSAQSTPAGRTWLRRGVEECRAVVVGTAIVLSIILFFAAIVSEAIKLNRALMVMPIETPEELTKEGYTPSVVTQHLISEINEIMGFDHRLSPPQFKNRSLFVAIRDQHDLVLPNTTLTIRSVALYLRRLFGSPSKVVSGALLRTESGDGFSLHLLIDGEILPQVPESVQGTTINEEVASGAREVVWKVNPVQLARYYYDSEEDLPTVKKLAPVILAKSVNTPYEGAAVNLQGLMHLRDAEYEAAIKNFERSKRLDPQNGRVYINWGYALIQMAALIKEYEEAIEMYDEAMKKYQKAIKLDSGFDAVAYYGWGVVHAQKASILAEERGCEAATIEEYDKAVKKFDKSTKINRGFAHVYYLWGTVLHEQANACPAVSGPTEMYNRAMEKYEKAIERDPDFVYPYVTWGEILAKQGDFRGAIEKYIIAANIRPIYARVYRSWGNALFDNGKCNEGLEKYMLYAKFDPTFRSPPVEVGKKCRRFEF